MVIDFSSIILKPVLIILGVVFIIFENSLIIVVTPFNYRFKSFNYSCNAVQHRIKIFKMIDSQPDRFEKENFREEGEPSLLVLLGFGAADGHGVLVLHEAFR